MGETFAEVPGLTLFRDVVSAEFHDELCALVERLLIAGRKGQLEGKTFCAVEKESRRAGVSDSRAAISSNLASIRTATRWSGQQRSSPRPIAHHPHIVSFQLWQVEPIPPLLDHLIETLVSAGIFEPDGRPDSCTISM